MRAFLYKGDVRCLHCIRDNVDNHLLIEVKNESEDHRPHFKTLSGDNLPEIVADFCNECGTS